MKDTFLSILAVFSLFVAVPVLLLWFRDRLRGRRHPHRSPEERIAQARKARESFLHPNPDIVESELGGLLPERLITLYRDEISELSGMLEIRPPSLEPKAFGEFIQEWLPLNIESQKYTVDLEEANWGKGFCFAADGTGNFYWVPVGSTRQPDAPVYFACHDPWGNEKIADSLDEFLSWPRVPHSSRFRR